MADDANKITLIVPVNVQAFLVSQEEYESKTQYFSGREIDFGKDKRPVPFSPYIDRALDKLEPEQRLKKGIHLHWALPDAFKKIHNGNTVSPVPNRWLVNRIWRTFDNKKFSELKRTSTVIISDALSGPFSNSGRVTVPTQQVGDLDYSDCGLSHTLKGWAKNPLINDDFESKAGAKFSYLANSKISFSAYYPNCSGIFGFHDQLGEPEFQDIDLQYVDFIYVVTGWYSKTDNDPVREIAQAHSEEVFAKALSDFEEKMAWKFKSIKKNEISENSLYSGSAHGIRWSVHRKNFTFEEYKPTSLPTASLEIGLGSTLNDTLAAYLQNKLISSQPIYQEILTSYLEGWTPTLYESLAEQREALPEIIDSKQFTSFTAEYSYIFSKKKISDQQSAEAKIDEKEEPLPDHINHDLHLLNRQAELVQFLDASLRQEKWQLFADAYRILVLDKQGDKRKEKAERIAEKKFDNVKEYESKLEEVRNVLTQMEAALKGKLPKQYELEPVMRPYWQPMDPAFLLAGDHLKKSSRYGTSEPYIDKSFLHCRFSDEIIDIVKLKGTDITTKVSKSIKDGDIDLLNGNLPFAKILQGLINEAALLDPSLLQDGLTGKYTGVNINFSTIEAILSGKPIEGANALDIDFSNKNKEKITYPSLVGLSEWGENPVEDKEKKSDKEAFKYNRWIPVFAVWNINFSPIFATTEDDTTNSDKKHISNYDGDFFNKKFTLKPYDRLAKIQYLKDLEENIKQSYAGIAFLEQNPIQDFIDKLQAIVDENASGNINENTNQKDLDILKKCLGYLNENKYFSLHAFDGFTDNCMMRRPEIVLKIDPTQQKIKIVGKIASEVQKDAMSTPVMDSFYNPVRTGFFRLSITLVDLFGQKKQASISEDHRHIAHSLTNDWLLGKKQKAGRVYLPPRIAQPARLAFGFVAAGDVDTSAMNDHISTNTICGWLMTNRVNHSLFIHNAEGVCLGGFFLNEERSKLIWQSAPGNLKTIDYTADQVMRLGGQHPVLEEFVRFLSEHASDSSRVSYFLDLMQAIDTVNASVIPSRALRGNSVALTLDRPLALAQASLSLDLLGLPHYNQSPAVLELDAEKYPLAETENDFTKINFPVILGDLNNPNDGLVGFFKHKAAGEKGHTYEWEHFYSIGAPEKNDTGIRRPQKDTLKLRPSVGVPHATTTEKGATFDGIKRAEREKVLLLLDPRASVHATTAYLPTEKIDIPLGMYGEAMKQLAVTFLVAPVLTGESGLRLPLPSEIDHQWSWIQQELQDKTKPTWRIQEDVATDVMTGPWDYTPQTALEGWLHENPTFLNFDISNEKGGTERLHTSTNGTPLANALTLYITNKQQQAVRIKMGEPAPRDGDLLGSCLYIYFGQAVLDADVEKIELKAQGWKFKCYGSAETGIYLALALASPAALILESEEKIKIEIANVFANPKRHQASLRFYWRNVENVPDGFDEVIVTIGKQV